MAMETIMCDYCTRRGKSIPAAVVARCTSCERFYRALCADCDGLYHAAAKAVAGHVNVHTRAARPARGPVDRMQRLPLPERRKRQGRSLARLERYHGAKAKAAAVAYLEAHTRDLAAMGADRSPERRP